MRKEKQQIIILGKPIPQKRPRVIKRGKHIHTYDPSEKDKTDVMKQLLMKRLEIQEPPIAFYMVAHMPIPKSGGKKRMEELDCTHHIRRPDVDNIYKFYSDLLEGICYNNDSEIAHIYIEKRYSKVPRVEIEISTVE